MIIDQPITHGIFCCEIKNRFRAMVLVEGEEKLCYVASSCRLSNFLELEGREVLLLPAGENSSRTDYTLFAAQHKNGYILLELAAANAVIADQIHRRYFSFLRKRTNVQREKIVEGYKADLFIADTNTIVEIKTVISEEASARFPTVFSERGLEQLKKIEGLLDHGYKVCYLFASLCKATRCIEIDSETDFYIEFKNCVEKGMIYRACHLKTSEKNIEIDKMLPIKL